MHAHSTGLVALSVVFGVGIAPANAGSCALVEKAVEAGMKQQRIYAASFEQGADGKTGKAVMQAVTIGNTHYLVEGGRAFRPAPLESEEMRRMGSGLVGFSVAESCIAQGTEKIGGKSALRYSYSADLGNGPVKITLWIDPSTGLPRRGISDEPQVDVDVTFSKDGDLVTKKRPTGGRERHLTGFLFGEGVLPPGKGGIAPSMQAAMAEVLK